MNELGRDVNGLQTRQYVTGPDNAPRGTGDV